MNRTFKKINLSLTSMMRTPSACKASITAETSMSLLSSRSRQQSRFSPVPRPRLVASGSGQPGEEYARALVGVFARVVFAAEISSSERKYPQIVRSLRYRTSRSKPVFFEMMWRKSVRLATKKDHFGFHQEGWQGLLQFGVGLVTQVT